MASFVFSALQLGGNVAYATSPVAGVGFGYATYSSGIGSGLVGLAFQPSTGALFVTDGAGHLWRVPAAGGSASDLGVIAQQPRGITFGLDGKMYIARYGTGTSPGTGDVIEVNPATGAVLRTVATKPCLDGIATDPSTGDLLVTSCRQMFRVVAPASANPTIPPYALVYNAHAIQISASGQVFVNAPQDAGSCAASCTNDRSVIWDVTGGGAQSLRNVPGTNGLALVGILALPDRTVPHFVFTNGTDGHIQKVNLDIGGTNKTVLSGGDAGNLMTIGPDNCLYANQGPAVLRITKAGGTCDLETAGETIPVLGLDADDLTPSIGSPLTVTASMTGIGTEATSLTMLFDVAGANPRTGLPGTLIGGSLAVGWAKWNLSYTGTAMGTDTITARTTHLGFPVLSAPLAVFWGPLADTTPPIVKVKVTGPHGTTGFSCAALDAFVEIAVAQTCGFFTGSPTIEWQITEPESPSTVSGLCSTQTLNYPSPPTGTPFTCSVGGEGGSTQKTVTLQSAPIAPDVTVAAKTASNLPYVAGAPTRESVTVEFTCKAAYGPPFMTCGSAGAVFSDATLVNPPAPPGGCTTVACLPYTIVKATHTFSTDGTFTAAASVSDPTSRSDAESFGPVIIDKTAPAVTATPSRAPDLGGWYSADVTLAWSCVDAGVVVTGCTVAAPASQLVSGEGDVTYSKTAQDGVGNVGTGTFQVKLDKTAPVVIASATANGLPYTSGTLTRFDVVVTFVCADNAGGSGVATCPAPITVTSATPSVSATASDVAGNTSVAATFGPIVIDNTPPTIGGTPVPGPNADGWNTGAVVVTFVCSPDAVSCTAPQTVVAEGTTTVTGTATDAAGNTATTDVLVKIDSTKPTVSMTPPGGTFHPQVIVLLAATDSRSDVKGIQYTLSGGTVGAGTFGPAGGAITITAVGTTTLTATSTDKAGNVSDVKVGTFTISATPQSVATNFVVWGGNTGGVQVGQRVQFWGSDWHKQIVDKKSASYTAAGSFKGYAQTMTATTFAATTGKGQREDDDGEYDEKGRKIKDLPVAEYITVAITTEVTKQGKLIQGNVVGYAVLHVEPAKNGRYGERAFGIVVATY